MINLRQIRPSNYAKAFLIAIILLIIARLCSCTCEYHYSRMQKKCGKSSFVDTLLVHDSIMIPSVRKDTIFHYSQHDTVIIHQGRLTEKYYYNSHDSTVYLSGKCDTVFINKVIKEPYERSIIKVDYFPKWLMWLAIVLVIAGIIAKLLKLF